MVISGLWGRVRLVWWTTALCAAGYLALVLDDIHVKQSPWTTGTHVHDPNVVLAVILVTGYVIALQTERASALRELNAPREG
jgi:hypothetical protein